MLMPTLSKILPKPLSIFDKSLPQQHYTKVASITMYTSAINALAISNDGQLLASGGVYHILPCPEPADQQSDQEWMA
jgi:hypothetical protein